MTNWDLINEYIQKAMHSVERTHNASQELQTNATPSSFEQFKNEMNNLTEHLTDLQAVLDHQDTYAMDELADWLSKTFGGQPASYRHTPHLTRDK